METRPSLVQIHNYYSPYLENLYRANPSLAEASFEKQIQTFIEDGFSGNHMFAAYLPKFGYESTLIVSNCFQAQRKWCEEKGLSSDIWNNPHWEQIIAHIQVEYLRPNVLYLSHPLDLDSRFVSQLTFTPDIVCGWRAAPIPEQTDWSRFDLILSHLSCCRELALSHGAQSTEHFFPGFPLHLLDQISDVQTQFDIVFSGHWTPLHSERNRFLSHIAKKSQLANNHWSIAYFLASHEPEKMPLELKRINYGARWGLEMYRTLRAGKIILNAEINMARGEAGNMRLFEITGCGGFCLTEYQPNIENYFKPGFEIETFRDEEELIDKITYYLTNDDKRLKIAQRGQRRCHREYNMVRRTHAFSEILLRYGMDTLYPHLTWPKYHELCIPQLSDRSEDENARMTAFNIHSDPEALSLLSLSKSPFSTPLEKTSVIETNFEHNIVNTTIERNNVCNELPEVAQNMTLDGDLQVVQTCADESDSNDINSMIDTALDLLKRGETGRSLDLIMKAKKHDIATKDLDLVIALGLYAQQDKDGALKAVQSEISRFPNNKAAREFYEDLCSEMRVP